MKNDEWRKWARTLLRNCAKAENRIRRDFSLTESMGVAPVEHIDGLDDDELRRSVENWALGNISARRAALTAHARNR